jgi:hypothetical protein
MWLTIIGGIAGAILSYYTQYNDTQVREMLKDIAYDLNLALQKLDEISTQLNQLGAAIAALPIQVQQIVHADAINTLNTAIAGALIRYRTLLTTHEGPDNDIFKTEALAIYNDVSKARSELQALSQGDDIQYAPLSSISAPVALLIEMGLLYRLGRQAAPLRAATSANFKQWFARLLDDNVTNSLSNYFTKNTNALATSNRAIGSGLLGPAIAHPGTSQAVYCLEHQIGSLERWPGIGNTETVAEAAQITWIRIYGVVTIHQTVTNSETLWAVGTNEPQFSLETYARKYSTDQWYGPRPIWNITIQSYDSRDIQRFHGHNAAKRLQDILNSVDWHNFIAVNLPQATQDLAQNNQLILNVRTATDVKNSIQAALRLLTLSAANRIISSSEAA